MTSNWIVLLNNFFYFSVVTEFKRIIESKENKWFLPLTDTVEAVNAEEADRKNTMNKIKYN